MTSLFFSYSHADESLRDELEKHLAMLKRQGLIDAWHDRRILAGGVIDGEISDALERADIILLLVSSDFLNSDYCYSREMARAIERTEAGDAITIPVILRACDWHPAPFGKLRGVPRDGLAVTSWGSRDEAFADVAKEIRRAVESRNQGAPRPTSVPAVHPSSPVESSSAAVASVDVLPRSSNLRIKKDFSDYDKDTFIADAFAFLARFFEGSLAALSERHPEYSGRYERIDSMRFAASIYKSGKAIAQCAVSRDGYGRSANEIRFSEGQTSFSGGFNESLMVGCDDQKLFLKATMAMVHHGAKTGETLSEAGAAEYLWGRFIERLQ